MMRLLWPPPPIVARAGIESTILVGDFFDLDATSTFDAVIGDPP
jgi:hypothetical protein